MPRYQGRVQLYRDKKPLFARYQLEEQIEEIYSQKVELKSGGSIVIDPTEALVSIDVNSGRATKEKGIEETAFKTNTEAAQEIARQLRLRDLGGLIVIDFIDMRNVKHAQEIEKTLRQALKRDKARTQVSRISQFGLLELSRQRLKPTILEGNYLRCPHCEGSGLIKSTISLALTVLRRIRAEAAKETLASVKALLPTDVALYLLNQKRQEIAHLEEEYHLTLYLAGNTTARQNEYSLEFIKRDIVPESTPVSDKIFVKEFEEPVRPVTSVAAYRGDLWEEPEEPAITPPQPVIVAPLQVHGEQAQDVVHGEVLVAPVLAVPRGRVFWRLTTPSRPMEVVSVAGDRPSPAAGTRNGRHGPGRFSRRPRGGWWRRRASAGAQTDAAHRSETPKAGENPGQGPGSSLV
jgi:ribonuclease E